MNKLFSFSKIASIATILLLIFKLFTWNLNNTISLPILSTIEIANDIILITLFSYIYKLSTENSILKKPSLIGISSMSISIVLILYSFIISKYKLYNLYEDYYILHKIFSFAGSIGLFITFFFYSKFEKNKFKKIIYLIYPSIVILIEILLLFQKYYLTYENITLINLIFKSFNIIEKISLAIFYYTFSKIYSK